MSVSKELPFSNLQLKEILKSYPTPLYIYDENGIINASLSINSAFKWANGFRNYYAVKALPNPKILEIVLGQGMGLDCSSLTELMIADRLGVSGDKIMFSSNDTAKEEFIMARKLGAIINLDDISHLGFLEASAGLPGLLCFRYNPGNLYAGNSIIGQPEDAKFGMTKDQIMQSIEIAKDKGVKRFGLHIMAISNNLDYKLSLEIVKVVFDLAQEIHIKLGVKLEFINLGGGIGIPYRPNEKEFDLDQFSKNVKRQIDRNLSFQTKIYMECGRYITGPSGYLISTIQHIKRTYKTFIGLDASMHNLMRPGMYGAYHHISIIPSNKNNKSSQHIYDVTGSLCENNDKFAIDRRLPEVNIGDILVIHDVGAHGHAMGFNYNGKLRSAEVLLRKDNRVKLIRRAETPEDYFTTLI